MRFLIILTVMFPTAALAEVSREEASGIIDEMVNTRVISAEEGQKAKARLSNMNSSEWSTLNKEAEDKVSRMPASVPESEESSNSDLSQEQFLAIQNDLAVIAPHYVSEK